MKSRLTTAGAFASIIAMIIILILTVAPLYQQNEMLNRKIDSLTNQIRDMNFRVEYIGGCNNMLFNLDNKTNNIYNIAFNTNVKAANLTRKVDSIINLINATK